jgi:hypothetical protein
MVPKFAAPGQHPKADHYSAQAPFLQRSAAAISWAYPPVPGGPMAHRIYPRIDPEGKRLPIKLDSTLKHFKNPDQPRAKRRVADSFGGGYLAVPGVLRRATDFYGR